MLTGDARGRAEHPDLQEARTTLIAVTASFGGLALFIAIFVVASTMGLSIQQREREIALLRAVAATPGQIRRMIAWEAAIVGLVGSAAGIWPGRDARPRARPTGSCATASPRRTSPSAPAGCRSRRPSPAESWPRCSPSSAAGRRAARVPPTHALADAAVEPRLLGPGRVIGGLLALAGAVPLFAVSATTGAPDDGRGDVGDDGALPRGWRSASSDRSWRASPPGSSGRRSRGSSPVGGFLASANLAHRHAALLVGQHAAVLTVAMSCTLLFSATTIDHAVTQERQAGLSGELAITSTGPGLPAAALADARATPGVRSAVALTPTTLGPSLGRLRRHHPRRRSSTAGRAAGSTSA